MTTQTTQPDKIRELAKKISSEFQEAEKQELYENLFMHYSIDTIHKAYDDVKKVPLEKIKKSQSALFIYLLRKYDKR